MQEDTRHVHNEEEVSRIRDLADYLSNAGCPQDILVWAQVAGTSLEKKDLDRFLGIVHNFSANPFRQEAIMVLIRLLLDSDNFDEARQFAADLCKMEHHLFHAVARARIAKFSGDREDAAIAEEFLREFLELYLAQK